MNRTDRLLAIVLELQGKGWQRAADLARTFETSKRTIYRDLEALGQSGVPIVAVCGRGYSLVEGYFLPPLRFTLEEATMLILGSEVMAASFDEQYRRAAEDAQRKIVGVLPATTRDAVSDLQQRIQFIPDRMRDREGEEQKLQRLRRALLDRQIVTFTYHTRFRPTAADQSTESLIQTRTVDPQRLISIHAIWYLTAWDHDRQARRNFRLDRIEDLQVTALPARQRGSGKGEMDTIERPPTLIVRVLFAHEIARWVRESPHYFTISQEACADGLLMTLHVRQIDEILQWLLSWGRHVRILEPDALRAKVADEARAILANDE